MQREIHGGTADLGDAHLYQSRGKSSEEAEMQREIHGGTAVSEMHTCIGWMEIQFLDSVQNVSRAVLKGFVQFHILLLITSFFLNSINWSVSFH